MSWLATTMDIIGGVRKLNSNYMMPLIGLGTYKVTGQETVTVAVDAALKSGYRMFDTAKYYKNEAEIGNALKELLPKYNLKREDIFITTKFFPSRGNNSEYVKDMVNESLNCLQTDYLDLVLIHYPKADASSNDDPKNAEHRRDCYLALEKYRDNGVIRSIGVSNYEITHLEEIKGYSKTVPAVNQVEFHPHFTREKLKNYCDKEGIFFQAFSSLARNHPDLINDSTLVNIAKLHNTTVQLLLLAWPLGLGVGIVPKSTSPQRIVENISSVKIKLTDDELKQIAFLNKDKHYIRCDGWNVL
uniref:Aldo_ket_red domain-containing protein n=1 Tax=Syphacia muris TaxID=451379 RepID=A0A0N5ALA2_9BILA